MNVEGVELTHRMLTIIREWQEGWMKVDIDTLNEAISFIAKESDGCEDSKLRTALNEISGLCVIKDKLSVFNKEGESV